MEAQCEQRDDPHRLERKGSKHERLCCFNAIDANNYSLQCSASVNYRGYADWRVPSHSLGPQLGQLCCQTNRTGTVHCTEVQPLYTVKSTAS